MNDFENALGSCHFPDVDWHPTLLAAANESPRLLPGDWRARLHLPPPPHVAQGVECAYLKTLVGERERRRADIVLQDSALYRPVQKVVGSLDEKPKTQEAISALYANVDIAIYYAKRMFARGRPGKCCADFEPMFKPEEPIYPRHPAYPSGHATHAFGLAEFYARILPARRKDLLKTAAEVAFNREVAGFHYPSDTAAGRSLASQLLALLLENAEFQGLYEAAAKEWR